MRDNFCDYLAQKKIGRNILLATEKRSSFCAKRLVDRDDWVTAECWSVRWHRWVDEENEREQIDAIGWPALNAISNLLLHCDDPDRQGRLSWINELWVESLSAQSLAICK